MKIWLISGSFKPYYKWNTFNTFSFENEYTEEEKVLNLIINGIPSIPGGLGCFPFDNGVLNLIINGIPSIQNANIRIYKQKYRFKPYYKWNTFNT